MSSGLGNSLRRSLNKKRQELRKHGCIEEKKLPIQSVVTETDLEALMNRVLLQQKLYDSDHSLTIIDSNRTYQPPTISAQLRSEALKLKCENLLKIPKRPHWTLETSKEKLEQDELHEFYQWRKKLSILESSGEITISPYEKNLDVWRQLWRSVERSDIIVQILDARNPLLFRCSDLEGYVSEISKRLSTPKKSVLLLNKADLLPPKRLTEWIDYFHEENTTVIFYSATEEDRKDERILSSKQLIEWMETQRYPNAEKVVIGFVGYPNVGKSSTINSIFPNKRVAVSATPGKTKHLQTLELSDSVHLCDCPGLVFPSFTSSKAELVVNGIVSVENLNQNECIQCVALICQQMTTKRLAETLSLRIDGPTTDTDLFGQARMICGAYASKKNWMSHKAIPHESRAARVIVKFYTSGSVVYAYPPPGIVDTERIEILREERERFERAEAEASEKFNRDYIEQITAAASTSIEPSKLNSKKHFKANKHVKLRNKFAHLDKH